MIKRTDATGQARISWLPRWATQCEVTASKSPDYSTSSGALPSPSNQTKLQLKKRVLMSGRVVDPDGAPAPGIRVLAGGSSYTSNIQSETLTDSQGQFRFHLPAGMLYMLAVHDQKWQHQHARA